jgi:cell division protein FtsB
MSCVYFIRKGSENIFKIGKGGNDGSRRLKGVQTGNESKLVLCAVIYCESPYSIEQYIHNAFAKYRLHGEWFCVSWDDILPVLQYYKDSCEVEILDQEVRASEAYINLGAMDVRSHQRLLERLRELERKHETLSTYQFKAWRLEKTVETLQAEMRKLSRRNKELQDQVTKLLTRRPPQVEAAQPEKKRKLFGIFG